MSRMTTVRENINRFGEQLNTMLSTFLTQHSNIYRWNDPNDNEYVAVFSTSGNHAWKDLSVDARRLQSKLLQEFNMFSSLVGSLLHEQSDDTLQSYREFTGELSKLIQQNSLTWYENTSEALASGTTAIQGILDLINRLYSASAEALFVPDSNALISNPAIEQWSFPNTDRFSVVFTATVLSELDSMKVNHRNEAVRTKAEQVIRQIKEYRRRGDLSEGVPLLSNKVSAKSIATEPNFETTLPWLDPKNNNDRIIASVIEIMRKNTAAKVTIVSGDINLQNKADFARIPCCEPPSGSR